MLPEKGRVLDDDMLESLEELLIQADMGVETALKVTAAMAEGAAHGDADTPRPNVETEHGAVGADGGHQAWPE